MGICETKNVGLKNIGAICYMNSVLQCLYNIKELTSFFLKKFTISKNDPNKRLSNEYCIVIRNLDNSNNYNKSYSPVSFKNVLNQLYPMFSNISGNEPKDLINFLLERLHLELNTIVNNNINNNLINTKNQLNENVMRTLFLNDFISSNKSPISNLFYGVIETQTQCSNCCIIKYNFQIFTHLDFPLQQVNQYCFQTGKRMNVGFGNSDIDLYECFEYYESLFTMAGVNQIYCLVCQKAFNAQHRTLLYSIPNYLIINLNRGSSELNVKFPEKLNLSNYAIYKDTNTIFDLISVICRINYSHFIAYCRSYKDNHWYKFDDSEITKCKDLKKYLNGIPQILFYKVSNYNA